uniref:Ras family GTPase n=1 Tax=Iridovirus LCIVAC01 TaxID=2506607 RepID=A0A481YQ14_9VIRU|nr:MAG: Ras family GTPase [Iridovirus LCIVAC01]
MSSFKIVIVGDANVGKTSYVERLITGNFIEDYEPTWGASDRQYKRNGVTYNFWDCAGDPELAGEKIPECFLRADGAIVMFDASKPFNAEIVAKDQEKWTRLLLEKVPGIPIIFCGNLAEWIGRETYGKHPYYPMSVRDCFNLEKPFEYFEHCFCECEDCGLRMRFYETICNTCGWNSITSQSYEIQTIKGLKKLEGTGSPNLIEIPNIKGFKPSAPTLIKIRQTLKAFNIPENDPIFNELPL